VLAVHHSPGRVCRRHRAVPDVQARGLRQNRGHAAVRDRIAEDMASRMPLRAVAALPHRRLGRVAGLPHVPQLERSPRRLRQKHPGRPRDSLAFLLFSTVFHWWMFVVPWLWMAYSLFGNRESLLAASFFTPWDFDPRLTAASTASGSGCPAHAAIGVPDDSVAFQALKWHFSGGPLWKGRKLTA